MESTATFEATSPAACPPIPSATTNRRCSALATKLSSFPLRLRPTSVTAFQAMFIARKYRSRLAPEEASGDGVGRVPGQYGFGRLARAQVQTLRLEGGGEIEERGHVPGLQARDLLEHLDPLPCGLGML